MVRDGYHHGALTEALIEAGVAATRTGGPAALSVRALAKELGVSPAAVYRHFPSIEHLLTAVAQVARESLAERLILAREATTGGRTKADRSWRRFRAIGRAYIEFAIAEPHLFDTAFAPCEISAGRPDDPDALGTLLGAVEDLVATGAISAASGESAPLIAWSSVHGIASLLVRNSLMGAVGNEQAIETVLDGVTAALGGK
jgi:AcrR family transcriptional regulator